MLVSSIVIPAGFGAVTQSEDIPQWKRGQVLRILNLTKVVYYVLNLCDAQLSIAMQLYSNYI